MLVSLVPFVAYTLRGLMVESTYKLLRISQVNDIDTVTEVEKIAFESCL